jgi:adenine-specific DNA-methyltransferase
MERLLKAERIASPTSQSIQYVRFLDDFAVSKFSNVWTDTQTGAFTDEKVYVVQTNAKVIERCFLMTTDPGDLVLDPTCGSGTTATVADQWGRRWMTIDTSRVALALARARIMGARYPWYLLADSAEGRKKEAELSGRAYAEKPTYNKVRQGFVYERVPHITLKSIANNAEIDVIWESWQEKLEPLRKKLNAALRQHWEEWEIPREPNPKWSPEIKTLHGEWWQARIARQKEIDASIAAKAEFEPLYDKPCEGKKTVRVAGPFTVESLSPHRMLGVDENDNIIDPLKVMERQADYERGGRPQTFDQIILENLRVAGVQQVNKADRITFTRLTGWPGRLIGAEGRYRENSGGKNAPVILREGHVAPVVAESTTAMDSATAPVGSAQNDRVGSGSAQNDRSGNGFTQNDRSGNGFTQNDDNAPSFCAKGAIAPEVAESTAAEKDTEKRAAILIGPEFGSVRRADLTEAAREAAEAGFDVLISLAFNFDAHSSDLDKLGRIPILRARMNADLHMAEDLKTSNTANLFVIFGEPDITLENAENDQLRVKVNGIDIFDPSTGEVRSDETDGIACWMLDTDYNGESFFVRHAYFLGQNDPYKALKTTLKAEIDADVWSTLNSDTSRPFPKPESGRIAVKVINHLGDEVMKVFKV